MDEILVPLRKSLNFTVMTHSCSKVRVRDWDVVVMVKGRVSLQEIGISQCNVL